MIAVDSNILVYAHRRDSAWHGAAAAVVREIAEARAAWAIPWPCIHEFLAIASHPKIYAPPSTIAEACEQVDSWFESPSLVLLGETEGYWSALGDLLRATRVTGARVHDARIAAICSAHGVRELLSADRDFSRFPSMVTRNPLVG